MSSVEVTDPKPMDIVTEVSILRADNQSNSINDAERETDTAVSLRRSQRYIDKKLKDSSQTDDFIPDPMLSDPVNHPIRMTQRCFDVHKGVYCAAASACHTPHEYSSLNPVPFHNISLHFIDLYLLYLIITYIQQKLSASQCSPKRFLLWKVWKPPTLLGKQEYWSQTVRRMWEWKTWSIHARSFG